MAHQVVVAALLFAPGSPLAIATAVGAHRRGCRGALVVLAGVGYPVTWVVWYLRDQHPYSRTG